VGTCRLGFSDIGIDGGGVSEGGFMRKMGDESMMGGEEGRGPLFISVSDCGEI